MNGKTADPEDCLFCRIGHHQAPAEYVYEDDTVFVIKDRFPKAPIHLLVIPRRHIDRIDSLGADDASLVLHLLEVVQLMARRLQLQDGYRVIVNSGARGGQTIQHLHIHILAGSCLGPGADRSL
ncbi:MAG TPA: HIT domain-containing protein [Candidatus Cryosericum sp.]|nr:HIT domain-containing protein [Candidatus Cryosericum sp.]